MKLSERKYKTSEAIIFSNTHAPFGGLSNMASGYPLFINDVIISNAECLYQACRFPLFPEIQLDIINERNPMKAKFISRKYIAYTRQDWNVARFNIMRWVLRIKLIQNWESFSELLMRTDNKPIVELSAKDKVWAAKKVGSELVGVNALGRLLMELREDLNRNKVTESFVSPLEIPGFLLFGYPICRAYRRDQFIAAIEKETSFIR